MNLMLIDNVLQNPIQYVKDILNAEFVDVFDGVNTFQNIQPRSHNDELSQFVLNVIGNEYEIAYNFARKSPHGQNEPNYVHTDDMMGDLTVILYLSKSHPEDDGTTIYDADGNRSCVFYSKFNRMIVFESYAPHSRNIFDNFGQNDESRLVQVMFLKRKK